MAAETHAEYMARRASELKSGSNTYGINTVQPTAPASAHNNLQPYIVTYLWERTA